MPCSKTRTRTKNAPRECVIASAAKQSRAACGGREAVLDCFVAGAPRNDECRPREREFCCHLSRGPNDFSDVARLSEGGEDNLGLACTANGLVLGRTPLIERQDRRFVVRERNEIERLLRRAYESDPPIERIMSGLGTVARALNADDQCLARIAAVHLRIPHLPTALARSDMETEDRLIEYARDEGEENWDPAKHPRTGTPPNPGWFAPTDGGGESSPTQIAANDNPALRSDALPPGADADWVRLPPGPQRIDELADFVEWMANAKPRDEQTIRAEIKRYYYDVGDQGSAAALNSALTALLKPGLTRDDRQRILDSLDVFTRADPAEYVHNRDWTTGAAIAAGNIAPGASGEAAAGEEAAGGTAAERTAPSEGAAAQTAANAPSEVWTYGWAKRGREIHELLGDGSLPWNFPTIDMISPTGVVTSLKSIDLNAATYQKDTTLMYRASDYVGRVSGFDGDRLGDAIINSDEIKGRVLQLVIPKGSMTKASKSSYRRSEIGQGSSTNLSI